MTNHPAHTCVWVVIGNSNDDDNDDDDDGELLCVAGRHRLGVPSFTKDENYEWCVLRLVRHLTWRLVVLHSHRPW